MISSHVHLKYRQYLIYVSIQGMQTSQYLPAKIPLYIRDVFSNTTLH